MSGFDLDDQVLSSVPRSNISKSICSNESRPHTLSRVCGANNAGTDCNFPPMCAAQSPLLDYELSYWGYWSVGLNDGVSLRGVLNACLATQNWMGDSLCIGFELRWTYTLEY